MKWPDTGLVLRLGTAQTLAWASTYYLPALLARPMAGELGLADTTVWLHFSLALGLSALLGPASGRAIDRQGGRRVLCTSSLVFAAGLATLGLAPNATVLLIGWLLLGLGMGCGLYDAAFATLVRLKGEAARAAITGVTLLGGFASTVGWPLSAWLSTQWGWREACLAWAALHLLIGLPCNASLPRMSAVAPLRQPTGQAPTESTTPVTRRGLWVGVALAYVFGAAWFVSTALAAHLPQMLMAHGASLSAAVATAARASPVRT